MTLVQVALTSHVVLCSSTFSTSGFTPLLARGTACAGKDGNAKFQFIHWRNRRVPVSDRWALLIVIRHPFALDVARSLALNPMNFRDVSG